MPTNALAPPARNAMLRPYAPSWREQIEAYLMGDSRPSPERRQFAQGLTNILGLVPGVGSVLQAQEAAQSGDRKGVAMAMLPIPGAARAGAVAKAAEREASGLSERLASKYPRVDFHISEGRGPITVNKVVVPPELRGQGVGTQFMQDVMAHADQVGRPVALSPSSDFGGSKSRLVNWYRSLGFVPNKGRGADLSISESMFRPVQAPAEQPHIVAYHGSPHSFDRFDMSKIGTGEGAQAYGHGLYFADSEDVAKSYRDALAGGSQRFVGDEPYRSQDPVHLAASLRTTYAPHGGDKRILEILQDDVANMNLDEKSRDTYQKTIDLIKGGAQTPEFSTKPSGSMYQVRINADPEHFLDWDKPLSEQSPVVRDTLKRFGLNTDPLRVWNVKETAKGGKWTVFDHWGQSQGTFADKAKAEAKARQGTYDSDALGGMYAYSQLGGNTAYSSLDKGAASAKLREAGIPGIKYLDQGSRGAGEGSRNYVVFDDKLVEIMKKYGLVGPIGAGIAAKILSRQEQRQEF